MAKLADDKEKQEQVFKLLEVLFYKEIATEAVTGLGAAFAGSEDVAANVSFQNRFRIYDFDGKLKRGSTGV